MIRSLARLAAIAGVMFAAPVFAQGTPPPTGERDSVKAARLAAREPSFKTIAPGPLFGTSAFRAFFLGVDYRRLWTTPLRVPELDLATAEGGLRPMKVGGGMQTKSLRLETKDGREFVFREVMKKNAWNTPPQFRKSLVQWLGEDQRVTEHPTGALVVAPLLAAAGILHPTPILVVLPASPALGEFSAEFGGKLGMFEEFPGKADQGVNFAGASKIFDSDKFLNLINTKPSQRVNAREFLAARLVDFLIGDWDRHPGQWKFAQFKNDAGAPSLWRPIARDRDKALVTYEGIIALVGRAVSPVSQPFDAPVNVSGLTEGTIGMDRRLLGELSKHDWDSVTTAVVARVTDAVIDSAVRMLPAEYASTAPPLAAIFKRRRDELPDASKLFFAKTFNNAEVHGTDAADVLSIERVDPQFVDVRISSKESGVYYSRRFDRDYTKELRIYLHGDNDTAVVRGNATNNMALRIIGGTGTNVLVDSSTKGTVQARFYNAGRVDSIDYGPDTLFNRRPWERALGVAVPPQRDYGASWVPIAAYSDERGLGLTPRFGVSRYRFAFGERPYASRITAQGEYASQAHGWRLLAEYDRRRESSPLHWGVSGRMSDLEVISYYGRGNATTSTISAAPSFNAPQRQWQFRPYAGIATRSTMDVSLGPIFKYSTADSARGRLISTVRPYGFGAFRQVGVQLLVHDDHKSGRSEAPRRLMLDVEGSAYPAALDVKSPFAKVSATAVTSIPIVFPLQPLLILRAGAKKLWGDYPWHEAAFVGGGRTMRYMESQRYAGDAALFATGELRLRLTGFTFIPIDAGILGAAEAGRVYLAGGTPDGWHTVAGGGFWIGYKGSPSVLSLVATSESGHAGFHLRMGLGF